MHPTPTRGIDIVASGDGADPILTPDQFEHEHAEFA